MKTFIMSYLVCIIPLIYAFLPTFQVSPVEAVTRICFYLAFPLAISLTAVIIAVKQLFGTDHYNEMAHSHLHGAADNAAIKSGLKVS